MENVNNKGNYFILFIAIGSQIEKSLSVDAAYHFHSST